MTRSQISSEKYTIAPERKSGHTSERAPIIKQYKRSKEPKTGGIKKNWMASTHILPAQRRREERAAAAVDKQNGKIVRENDI